FLNSNFSGVLSFSYQYLSNIEEEVYLKIYYAVKNDEYRLFENIDISEYENNVYTYDFTYYEKVKFIFESSSDDLTVDVLNIVIKHTVTEENIVNSLENLIPDVINESINLPTTTIYGGSVSWVSSHPDIISSSGVLNLPTSKTSVTLTATISYFEDDITYAVNIEVGEGQEVPSVYVYFLDVGKYGDSDMGESMMIKVGVYK
ncbi:MAG: immunoglobulin-like domain-containing protein, partial [Bacilli bacterium]